MSQPNSNTALILRKLQTDTGIIEVAQRPTDGYINITQLAKAAGKRVSDWRQNQDTQEYIEVLSIDVGIPTSKLIQIIQGRGSVVEQGTWAHPQAALKFAAWCDKRFDVQVFKWIDALRTQGVVDIRDTPVNPIQHALTAIADAVKALDTRKADVTQLYDVQRQLVLRIDLGLTKIRDEMQHGFGQVEKRFEMNRKAAIDRACRTAPRGHERWWWDIASGRYINPRCRILLDALAPSHAHNHPDLDEIIPVADGGRRCIANLQLICHGCNLRKSSKWIDYRPPQVAAQAMDIDAAGARYHATLREKLSQQLGLFDS
jgi:5-methylcytosine-specific restriction endonuclease McrA